jgi:hypothetical protein
MHRPRIGPSHPAYKTKPCRYGAKCRIQDCAFLHCKRQEKEPGEIRECRGVKRPREERSRNASPRRLPPPAPSTILIDGMNLCHAVHGAPPSARPLVRAIRHYESNGYKVHVVLPEWAYYGGKDRMRQVMDASMLTPFVRDGVVSFAPAYTDDDLFCLRFARDRPHIKVLSNDHYETHVRSGLVSHEWRSSHVIKYMFLDSVFVAIDL